MKKFVCFTVGLVLALPALAQNNSARRAVPTGRSIILQKELDSQASRISNLEKSVADLKSEISVYQFELDQKQQRHDTILLDPSSRTFQRLDTDTSSFLVAVEDVVPYLNGYKLTVSIGNPTTATFSGVTIKIRWGKAYNFNEFSDSSYAEWSKSIQEKDVSLTGDLSPGSWNDVDLYLLPATADELGYLEISMTSPTISLHRTQ